MTHRIFRIITMACAFGLTVAAWAAWAAGGGGGGGGGGSHGGASIGSAGHTGAGAGTQHTHGSSSKPQGGAKATHSTKTPSQRLASNPKLSAKLSQLLPAGTNMQTASAGFKNLGQFVAAVHVSNNLGIPFSDLKGRMMQGDSLGASIKALQPTANADAALKQAGKQATRDLSVATKLPQRNHL